MRKKVVNIIGAVKRTVKQRMCKHIFRVHINQTIEVHVPLKYECKKCNKIVWKEIHLD